MLINSAVRHSFFGAVVVQGLFQADMHIEHDSFGKFALRFTFHVHLIRCENLNVMSNLAEHNEFNPCIYGLKRAISAFCYRFDFGTIHTWYIFRLENDVRAYEHVVPEIHVISKISI